MRVSTLTSVVLATVVSSAAGKATYLKSSDGDYLLGSYSTSDSGDAGLLAFYPSSSPGKGQFETVSIESDTTLSFGGDFNFYLDPQFTGPENLIEEVYAFELVRDDPAAAGFSWGQDGTLELSSDKFHGWVHCQGGGWTGADGNSTFFWSAAPIKTLPDGCGQVDLVKA
ncbi:uncharacterized protein TRUGW13939_02602 [Talaromyces rugulosus]|uniref:DUF7907 domain-containing protein n=1 Tax=Talaromyces rugulosus TaxID=121627 RepID=A0A7H8QNS5_TALRU|nr:uncharacterized protein TRUGW13939_02602 [Talaromyces rugulosus]QKX55509.1 hypothetical protein TRUGW13939_02602 [Talaromyces rugulosus]